MPNCDKCAKAKDTLGEFSINGSTVDLSGNDGRSELRQYYKELKDNIKRDSEGQMLLPLVLFFDKDEKAVGIANTVDEIKSVLG